MNRPIAWTVVCPAVALVALCNLASAGEPVGSCCYGFSATNPYWDCIDQVTQSQCATYPQPSFWRAGLTCGVGCDTCLSDSVCDDNDPCTYDRCDRQTGLCVRDNDVDDDGVPNCQDGCPYDPNVSEPPGPCGCYSRDSDQDGICDLLDPCPDDPRNPCLFQAPAVSTWGAIVLLLGFAAGVGISGRRPDKRA